MPREGFSRKRLILLGETDSPPRGLNVECGTWNVRSVIPHDKLFTPGPVEVSTKTLAAFARRNLSVNHEGDRVADE